MSNYRDPTDFVLDRDLRAYHAMIDADGVLPDSPEEEATDEWETFTDDERAEINACGMSRDEWITIAAEAIARERERTELQCGDDAQAANDEEWSYVG